MGLKINFNNNDILGTSIVLVMGGGFVAIWSLALQWAMSFVIAVAIALAVIVTCIVLARRTAYKLNWRDAIIAFLTGAVGYLIAKQSGWTPDWGFIGWTVLGIALLGVAYWANDNEDNEE